MKKIICVLMCIILLGLSFTSCTGRKSNKSADNIDSSVFIKLPVSMVDSFNPYKCETEFNSQIMLLLYDGLIKVGEDLTYSNAIASGVNVQKKSINVTIRGDAYFSDGTRVTANDVVYSFDMAKQSDFYGEKLFNFDSASSYGDLVVNFSLKNDDVFCINCLDFPIIKSSVKQSTKENETSQEEQETELEQPYPIGCGKYKFEGETRDTLTLNEYWYGSELPKIRRIKLINLIDNSDAVKSMETGNISYLFQDLSSGIYNRVNAKTSKILMSNMVFLGINSYSKCLAKLEARQAINLVINKNEIVENAFLSFAEVAQSPFSPKWAKLKEVYYDKKDEKEDILEANHLLDNAGYAETNSFGMRTSSDTELTLLVNSDNGYKVSAADIIVQSMKSIGISVKVNKVPFDEYKSELSNVNYDLYIGEVKLSHDMSLEPFFGEDAGASFGINKDTDIVKEYYSFRAGDVSVQRFIDFFNVYLPFIPLCFRQGVASYTNELSYSEEGTDSDIFAGIYSWQY